MISPTRPSPYGEYYVWPQLRDGYTDYLGSVALAVPGLPLLRVNGHVRCQPLPDD
jgi:hypothetical protein